MKKYTRWMIVLIVALLIGSSGSMQDPVPSAPLVVEIEIEKTSTNSGEVENEVVSFFANKEKMALFIKRTQKFPPDITLSDFNIIYEILKPPRLA